MSEIKIHRSLHQVNVVQFEHVFEDQDNVYILLELCTNQVNITCILFLVILMSYRHNQEYLIYMNIIDFY